MVASLKKIDGRLADTVYQSVFLRDAPGPTTCKQVFEWFRLARTVEWIAHHRVYQIEHPDCGAPVGFDPISQVLPEFGMEDSGSLTFAPHRGSLAVIPSGFQASLLLA
jgi:hypothetical protein